MVKRKRVSKKNKASWRKNVDIKDVEEYLEELRQEERIGKVTDKSNDALFTIDITPGSKSALSNKERRKEKAKAAPKCFSVLDNKSSVKDPLSQRPHTKPIKKQTYQNPALSEKVSKIKRNKTAVKKERSFDKDIWIETSIYDKFPEYKNDWISKSLAEYHLKNTGNPVVKVHDSIRHKTSRIRAFETPHPGMSYNPSLRDHQALVEQVVQKESNIIKQENHLKRVTTDMFRKISKEEKEKAALEEMSIGIEPEKTLSDGKEGEHDDPDTYISINPPVEIKKKDKKARRNQKEQKELLRERQKKKLEKKKVTDIHRLRFLQKEVLKEESALFNLKKHRSVVKEQKKFEPRRIAKLKFQEPELEINMAEDIAGNLRNVTVETNLLSDRFKSLQKRNILPPSVDVGSRNRRKTKRFVRSSHRDL